MHSRERISLVRVQRAPRLQIPSIGQKRIRGAAPLLCSAQAQAFGSPQPDPAKQLDFGMAAAPTPATPVVTSTPADSDEVRRVAGLLRASCCMLVAYAGGGGTLFLRAWAMLLPNAHARGRRCGASVRLVVAIHAARAPPPVPPQSRWHLHEGSVLCRCCMRRMSALGGTCGYRRAQLVSPPLPFPSLHCMLHTPCAWPEAIPMFVCSNAHALQRLPLCTALGRAVCSSPQSLAAAPPGARFPLQHDDDSMHSVFHLPM